MVQAVIDFFTQYIPHWLTCFFISMLPILELRGGLVAASILGIPWLPAAGICILGNILPVPIILIFVRKVLDFLKTTRLFGRIASHFEGKALRGGARLMEEYPRRIQLGIFLFVAIPLPGTGAWTGSLVSAFLGVPIKRSLPVIILGVFAAACIMLLLAYAFPTLMGFKV